MIPVSKLSKIVGGKLSGNKQGTIRYLLSDSRKLTIPDDVAFFAISGEFHDGHIYINQLAEEGVKHFVVSKLTGFEKNDSCSFILVPDVVEAMQKLAAWWRNQFKIPVIGITGSNGKTIVKEWLSQCLEESKRVTRSPGSYNSQIGVPLSVWMLNEDSELGIFEAGISQPGEMHRIMPVIKPTIGILTNIGDPHQENFDSKDQKLREKLILFKNSDKIIYHEEHGWVNQVMMESFDEDKLFSWSFDKEADVNANVAGSNLEVIWKKEKMTLRLPLTDNATIENSMHVITTLIALGYQKEYIKEAFQKIAAVPMRLEQKAGKNNTTIINDSYNSDIGSLENALDFMDQQQQHKNRILILSDIFQSGYQKEELYDEVARLVNNHNIKLLIAVGDDISIHKEKFKVESIFFKNTAILLEEINKLPLKNATVLLKGSRSFQFEDVDMALEEKSHSTILEVNLNALNDNLNYFKSIIHDNTGIIAMVKAFSYGSGSFEIANVLQYSRVSYLAVAFADEGVSLREKGIELPIIVMNPAEKDFANITLYKLEPELYNKSLYTSFHNYLQQTGQQQYPVHIKVNTGMNRSGFQPDDAEWLLSKTKGSVDIYIKTVFSHLAASDDPEHDNFTHQQVSVLNSFVAGLEKNLNRKVCKHILNSAGIERFPEYHFDYVRLGIGMYGISAKKDRQLKQVGRLKTHITQIRKIEKGETIGYNRKGIAEKDSVIATIPIGYADGFRRALSNGVGKVWVNGKMAPVIGNICMDISMIDITGIPSEEGDEVIIFGPELSIQDVATWLDTIPYEILTNVSSRVKRIYIKE